jgi:carbon monoxide dehydrogenase subunit G
MDPNGLTGLLSYYLACAGLETAVELSYIAPMQRQQVVWGQGGGTGGTYCAHASKVRAPKEASDTHLCWWGAKRDYGATAPSGGSLAFRRRTSRGWEKTPSWGDGILRAV